MMIYEVYTKDYADSFFAGSQYEQYHVTGIPAIVALVRGLN
jgi:hypothetical protein